MFDELETDELVVPDVTYTVDPDDYDAAVSAHNDLERSGLSSEVCSGSDDEPEDAASVPVRPSSLISARVQLVRQSAMDADVDLDLYGRRVEEIKRPGKRTIKRFVTLTSATVGKYQ